MNAKIHLGDEDPQSRIGKIVGDNMYVKAKGKNLPWDFIIFATNRDGSAHGVKPVRDYTHAKEVVKTLEEVQED